MTNEIDNYEPVGPLRYLFMDKDGNSRVGIYEHTRESKYALIFCCYKDKYVITPEYKDLVLYFQNKIPFKNLVKSYPIKHLSGKALNMIALLKIKLFILQYLPTTVYSKSKSILYPNFYYVWNEHVINFPVKKQVTIKEISNEKNLFIIGANSTFFNRPASTYEKN